ncbi:MAG TPA: alginate export family protein, partial [Candidatus Krumholzibacterium sp.]|nr:alginate export family protein [Candidatus Krumholzibacterium sp.]
MSHGYGCNIIKAKSRSSRSSIIIMAAGLITATLLGGIARAEENGTPSFKWGFRERIRQAYIVNGFDLDGERADDRNYFRFRSQLWASWIPSDGVKLYLGLNNEHRHWLKSERGYEDEDFEIDELIVENLYVTLDRIGGSGFSVIAGRQNIRYGEGFLMLDGGPLDGSRTAYHNAVRVKRQCEKRSIEVHVLRNPSWDHYMPVINTQYKRLIEWDETGAGVYYIDDSMAGKRLEAYYFYKNEKHEDDLLPESDIHTVGARVTGSFREGMPWAAEFAFQAGDRG